MRILYLHPRSWSGEYSMLVKLRSMGHEVCVLEERRGLTPGRWVEARDFEKPGDGIATCWYDPGRGWEKLATWPFDRLFKRGFEGRNLVHRMAMILRAIRRFRPEAIICSDGFSFAVPASFLRQLGLIQTPLVVSYIGGDLLDCPHAEYGRSRAGMTGWLLRRSFAGIDVLRPVSPLLKDVLLGDGVAPSRIRTCPSHLVAPAAVLARIREQRMAVRGQVRNRWGIPDGAPAIVTLSTNIKAKGLHVLAQGWKAVITAVPGARWLLCGPESEWLKQQVVPVLEKGGIAGSVIFSGSLAGEAVFEHLAAADLHVCPTLCEGLNMVTVEAAAVGTPTIVASGAGIAAWVGRHEAGAVVPSGEVAPLANAIIKALIQTNCLAAWSRAAVEMSGDFALEKIAKELLEILKLPRTHPTQ